MALINIIPRNCLVLDELDSIFLLLLLGILNSGTRYLIHEEGEGTQTYAGLTIT